MWSDNETTQDLLGYQVHADLLRKIILNDAMLPISIGVFGNWGSGKSSLMLLLQQSLQEWEKSQQNEQHSIILQVYFNSWQFESYDSTKLTMIESILEALDKDINTRKDVFERADDSRDSHSLQESLADRAVLQVAQAASQNQEILGHYSERCQNTNLLCDHNILPCCHHSTRHATEAVNL